MFTSVVLPRVLLCGHVSTVIKNENFCALYLHVCCRFAVVKGVMFRIMYRGSQRLLAIAIKSQSNLANIDCKL